MTENASYKLVLIGDQGVGKSNLLTRFTQDRFDPSSRSTIGVDFGTKFVQLGDNVVKLQIWDTAGQENYRALAPTYYRGASGVVVVYDITRRETFEHVEYWMTEVRNNMHPDATILLVGNKSDQEATRAVSRQEAEQYAEKHKLYFMETSAMDSSNVSTSFEWILNTVYNHADAVNENSGIKLDVTSSKKNGTWRSRCCRGSSSETANM
eukprot:Em0012g497a